LLEGTGEESINYNYRDNNNSNHDDANQTSEVEAEFPCWKLSDYHVHPGYSIDAIPATIRQYCLQAVKLGLKEICFTPHLEYEAGRPNINNRIRLHGEKIPSYELRWLDAYLEEIEEARKEFAGEELTVKFGLEIGYNPYLEELIYTVLQEFPFDFVLGAVHSINGISISSIQECPEYFRLCTLDDLRQDYFSILDMTVKTSFFDCLAHVDIYRRYGYDYYGPDIVNMHRGAIEPVLREAARRKVGLEINTSSIRRGGTEFHPSQEILSLALEAGIEFFTVGSDAHELEELGDHLKEAYLLLETWGQTACGFSNREPYALTLDEHYTRSSK